MNVTVITLKACDQDVWEITKKKKMRNVCTEQADTWEASKGGEWLSSLIILTRVYIK